MIGLSFAVPSGVMAVRSRDGYPDWPPSPGTVLAALVATATGEPDLDVERVVVAQVLARLQTAGPPVIFGPRTFQSQSVTRWELRYAASTKVKMWRDDCAESPPFHVVTVTGPLSYMWPDVEMEADKRFLLQRVAERVVYLGKSENLVVGSVVDLPQPARCSWMPDDDGPIGLTTYNPNRPLIVDADELEKGDDLKANRLMWVAYRKLSTSTHEPRIVEPMGGPANSDDVIPVRNVGHPHADGRRLADMSLDGVPPGYVGLSSSCPWGATMRRWAQPARSWVSTGPVPIPAKPSGGALAMGESGLILLGWSLLLPDSGQISRPLVLPEQGVPSRLSVSTEPLIRGAGRRRRYTFHLRLSWDEEVEGPVVVGGVLFAQEHDHVC